MNKSELALSLHNAISQLSLALAKLTEFDESESAHDVEAIESAKAELRPNEVLIWDDGSIEFGPDTNDVLGNTFHFAVRGRPSGMPLQTCPRCNGRGKI